MAKTVVAIGEALWDLFPDGRRPGGAPCNVAYHAARLGDRGCIVSRVGLDPAGAALLDELRARGLDTRLVQRDATRPTGSVTVKVEGSGPQYTITRDVAWDHLAVTDEARVAAATADAICVGTLAQREAESRETIRELVAAARGRALVVLDLNLRPPFVDPHVIEATLRLADVVRMNEVEADRVGVLLGRPALVPWLLETAGIRAVCVTRGANGAAITTPRGSASVPGVAIAAAAGDPVGAGDAFTAAMIHHLLRGADARAALEVANRYAALVAAKPGAMPLLSEEELAAAGV